MSDIETMIAEIDDLDNQIFDLEQTIADQVNALQEKRRNAKSALDEQIAKEALSELADKPYGCGTHNAETNLYKIKTTVSKGVKWDEKELFKIRQQIIAAGKNPAEYIKEKLSVTETAYKCFDEEIQAVFEPARTVTPSKPKIEIVRK